MQNINFIPSNIVISIDDLYLKYGLSCMINDVSSRLDMTYTERSGRVIFFNEYVSIFYTNFIQSQGAGNLTTELVVDIPFITNSLTLQDIMIKLKMIISLSIIQLTAGNYKDIYDIVDTISGKQLSNAENKILQKLGMGYCAENISSMLNCSSKTINSHIRSAMRKMGMTKKIELFNFAMHTAQHVNRMTICI